MILTNAVRLSKLLGAVLMFSVGAFGQADFSASPTTGTVPLSVQFTDLTPGAVVGWTWNFGDGSVGAGPTSMHTYDTPGTYSVTLSVFAGFPPVLESVTKTDLIVVNPAALVPNFSVSPGSGQIPLTVAFTDETAGVAPDSWAWEFGDGWQSAEQNPVHEYKDVGAFDVTLEVTYLGQVEVITKVDAVVVDPVVMVPDFTWDFTVGGTPLEVSFQNLSTGQEPTGWSWKANGSSIGHSQNETHVFESAGTYDVTLTMEFYGQEESLTVPDAIHVLPTVSFLAPRILGVGPDPLRLALGDVSGDGSLDILVSSSSQSLMRVLLNDGAGSFSAPVITHLPSSVSNWAVGDMNGDGQDDLVALLVNTPNDVVVLHSEGGGTFKTATVLSLSGDPILWVSILDADEDGANDVVIARHPVPQLFLGDGAGGVASEGVDLMALGNHVWAFVEPILANTDGHIDLLAVSPNAGFYDWDVLLGNGKGVFTVQPESMSSGGHGLLSVTTGDVTGDGFVDALASANSSLQLAHGTGLGLATGPGSEVFVAGDFSDMETGDLNADGVADLVASPKSVGGSAPGVLWLWTGSDSFLGGSLNVQQFVELHSQQGEIAVGDLDDDAVNDLVVLHPFDGSLTVLLNRTVPTGWTDVGHALAGTAGEPLLTGAGPLDPGSEIALELTNALPHAPSAVFVGLQAIEQPLFGGILVPAPEFVLVGASTDANGEMLLRDRWPLYAGPGISVWYQIWVLDPGGPHGASGSNAMASKS
jgi:PKD repeat protein